MCKLTVGFILELMTQNWKQKSVHAFTFYSVILEWLSENSKRSIWGNELNLQNASVIGYITIYPIPKTQWRN